jgi:hypothetical protein
MKMNASKPARGEALVRASFLAAQADGIGVILDNADVEQFLPRELREQLQDLRLGCDLTADLVRAAARAPDKRSAALPAAMPKVIAEFNASLLSSCSSIACWLADWHARWQLEEAGDR